VQIKTTVGHVYVPLRNEGAQIELSVENEALKGMSGPETVKNVDIACGRNLYSANILLWMW
jgi:hypothetical protein